MPLDWVLRRRCPLCGRTTAGRQSAPALCLACSERLGLPETGLQGLEPMPWSAVGTYRGSLRGLLNRLREAPDRSVIAALVSRLPPSALPRDRHPMLVTIPSWKRRGNPLPPLMGSVLSRQLGCPLGDLLERSRPVLGQHHLNRALRHANQQGAFRCRRSPRPGEAARFPLWLVDDILTTGSTAGSATVSLQAKGWRVRGLLCLARTELQGRDLQSRRRQAACRDSSVGRAGD